MGWWLYQNKTAMLAAGWTVKFSSDGTTGPASAADTTDRWPSAAVGPVTRATIAAAAQSWMVLQNVDGVQVLFAFQGGSDDICRVSMSQAGSFTLAAPTTQQPTAADEVIATNGVSVINATTSGDRVMSIGCTTESWWCCSFRASAIILFLSVEKIDSACDTVVLAQPYIVSKLTNVSATTGNAGGSATAMGGHSTINAQNASAWRGVATRVVTGGTGRIIRVGGGARTAPCAPANNSNLEISMGPGDYSGAGQPNGNMVANPPALNNGTIPVLTIGWFGERTANMDGYLGQPIDWWYAHTTSTAIPATGDFVSALAPGDSQATPVRTNWLVCIGAGVIRPWLNAAATMQIT
jgi:hypothetical protein